MTAKKNSDGLIYKSSFSLNNKYLTNLRFIPILILDMLIPTKKNVKTITDMRESALELLELVEKEGLAYIFHHSKPRAVMLSLEEFIAMRELLEDYLDQKEAKKLAKEKRGVAVPLKEIVKKYV